MKLNGDWSQQNIGITSTIKNYESLTYDKWLSWTLDGTLDPTQRKDTLIFAYRSKVSFCEDYKRVIVNACYELMLIKLRNNNCLIGDPATNPTFELFKVQWRMLHVLLSEINKLQY